MNRGGTTAILMASLGLGACATATSEVRIRPIGDSLSKLAGGDDVAVAKGQFALGNVGLALEAFRKIQRDRPSDPEVLAGIAECYAAMGRLDLAQSGYEAALAVAPRDSGLLLRLAQLLDRQGQGDRAAAVRAEAQQILSGPPPAAAGPVAPPTQAAMAAAGSITVELPPAASPASGVPASSATQLAMPVAGERVSLGSAEAASRLDGADMGQLTSSVTVALPPAEPAPSRAVATATAQPVELASTPITRLQEIELSRLSPAVTVARPSPSPSAPFAPHRPALAAADALPARVAGPRLERLSPGEVALVTRGQPLWTSRSGQRLASASGVRWIPLATPAAKPNVQLVNASRTQGLAATARAVLLDRGWRKVAIGTAPAARRSSVILYPRGREGLARRLGAQFGIRARMVGGTAVVLILGRDRVAAVRTQRQL